MGQWDEVKHVTVFCNRQSIVPTEVTEQIEWTNRTEIGPTKLPRKMKHKPGTEGLADSWESHL